MRCGGNVRRGCARLAPAWPWRGKRVTSRHTRGGSEDEVVKRANDTEYGLVAYLYTRDIGRGLRVSERLEYGMVGLNRGLVSDPAAPFGGMKQSGIGREGAHEGLMEFMETQYISVTW